MMSSASKEHAYYALRIASGLCFIGHGAFGIITKKIWLNYFAVFGIGHAMGHQLMPWLGAVDILMGLSLLLYPLRGILLWLVIWGALTALLRPLSGESFAEALERAGNYGAPLALLLLSNALPGKMLFERIVPAKEINQKTLSGTVILLKFVVFLALAGHGWLNLIGKRGLIDQYAAIGFSHPYHAAKITGLFEILAATSVLIKPWRPFLILLLVWKMGTELFYPHWEAFEWIERAGSYGTILALLLLIQGRQTNLRKGWLSLGLAPRLLRSTEK